MHTVEAVGAVALGGGLAGALITGFVLYLANHVSSPFRTPRRPVLHGIGRNETLYFARYNDRYVAVTRVAFYITTVAGVVGLILLVVGLVGS